MQVSDTCGSRRLEHVQMVNYRILSHMGMYQCLWTELITVFIVEVRLFSCNCCVIRVSMCAGKGKRAPDWQSVQENAAICIF